MITAKEAREKTEENAEWFIDKIMPLIEMDIQEAIKTGNLEVSLPSDFFVLKDNRVIYKDKHSKGEVKFEGRLCCDCIIINEYQPYGYGELIFSIASEFFEKKLKPYGYTVSNGKVRW